MSRPARYIDEEFVDNAIAGFGSPSPIESAQDLSDYQHVLLQGDQRLHGLRTGRRANCIAVNMIDEAVELGAHLLPGDGWGAGLLVYNTFYQRPKRRFSVVVSGTGRERNDSGEPAEDMIALLDAMTDIAGGREPDVVVFPINNLVPPSDYEGDPADWGQLIHAVHIENGQEIHTYAVPGTDYFREGTLEQLASSQPVLVRAVSS